MVKPLSIRDFLQSNDDIVLIDVRTPTEFDQGHIPGGFNLPLFSNEERVMVGTTYKQAGREQAILLGFDLAGPKWSGFIKEALLLAPGKRIAIHCWRGGMRSGAMAWALDLYGFDVYVIQGGYKKYRSWVHKQFEKPYRLWILGGMTGSGKTRILHQLKEIGQQVIDLEDLAQHQGSSYGSMNKMVQPSQEQFENNLANQLRGMHALRELWVEDESITIGKCSIPKPFWQQMNAAVTININTDLPTRVTFLTAEYGGLDKDFLITGTERIRKRLGPEQTKNAIIAIQENRMADFIRIALVYYDKAYRTGLSKRLADRVFSFELAGIDYANHAGQILNFSKTILMSERGTNLMETREIKLTQYSHGAGCGCKISPAILDKILQSPITHAPDARLLVGNDKRDDAAVFDLGNGTALISTTDFFMPIVDDAYDFGRIASANAISDVYAMGGKPVLAIAILGWPVDKLPPEEAQKILEGSRAICAEAGITLAGGHSIDCPEPVFGLAVNGLVNISELKQNSTATPGCRLYLTKPLGVGILSTAQKRGLLLPEDAAIALRSMTTLNKLGEVFAKMEYVKAMTDVTGFGLLGHLAEMCEGSGLSGTIEFDKVPVIPSLKYYLDQNCVPGGTQRNWDSYGAKIGPITETQKYILADPQTSGGLLVAVAEDGISDFEGALVEFGYHFNIIGRLHTKSRESLISVL